MMIQSKQVSVDHRKIKYGKCRSWSLCRKKTKWLIWHVFVFFYTKKGTIAIVFLSIAHKTNKTKRWKIVFLRNSYALAEKRNVVCTVVGIGWSFESRSSNNRSLGKKREKCFLVLSFIYKNIYFFLTIFVVLGYK